MSAAAIRGLMEDGERVLAEDVVEGPTGKPTPLVITSRAFYLSVGGRYTRYPYCRVRAATFDAHDVFIALDGHAVRLKYRPGTARSDALIAPPPGGAGPSLAHPAAPQRKSTTRLIGVNAALWNTEISTAYVPGVRDY